MIFKHDGKNAHSHRSDKSRTSKMKTVSVGSKKKTMQTGKAFGVLNGCLNLIATGIFFTIVFTAIRFTRDRNDVALILSVNTCIAALCTCISMCIMLSSNFWLGFLAYNMDLCILWGLFYDFCQCAIYHSYFLQAVFRLFRVVYYRKKNLLNYCLFRTLIFIQWIFTVLCLLPPFFLHWYAQITTEQYCLVPYTPLGPAIYHLVILYLFPLISITTIYVWITIYIRRSTRATAETLSGNQQRRNKRDLTMIKRIIIMIFVLVLMRFPTLVFIIYAMVFGYVHPVAFSVSGSIVSICLIFIALITIFFTPNFQNNICSFIHCRRNLINPRSSTQEDLGISTTGGSRSARSQVKKSRSGRTNVTTEPNQVADAPIATIT